MRAFVPVGYMAAFDERGLTLVACSGVVAYETKSGHAGAHAHHGAHGAGAQHAGDEGGKGEPSTAEHLASCPFAASSNSVFASLIEPPAPSNAFAPRGPVALHAPLIEIFTASFAARGPPVFI